MEVKEGKVQASRGIEGAPPTGIAVGDSQLALARVACLVRLLAGRSLAEKGH